MKKIAFCFLVYNEINFEETWFNFFKNADPNKYLINVHYKENIPLKHFEDKKLKECIPTLYAHISLIYAYNLLFKDALKDPDVYKLCILSNSCVPLKNFDYVYDFLTKDNYSHFNETHPKQCWPRCEQLTKILPREYITKSSAWFTLNRKHAMNCIANEKLVPYWDGINAPEEYYYLTIVKNSLYKDISIRSNIQHGSTHFVNWSDMGSYPYCSENGLKNYSNISKEEIDYLFNAPCLFGRKFVKNCTVDDNLSLEDYLINKIT